MKTKEQQRNTIRQEAKMLGESVSIPTKKEKKTYVRHGKNKSRRGIFIKNAKQLYG